MFRNRVASLLNVEGKKKRLAYWTEPLFFNSVFSSSRANENIPVARIEQVRNNNGTTTATGMDELSVAHIQTSMVNAAAAGRKIETVARLQLRRTHGLPYAGLLRGSPR